ncbi:hypothetical protein Tco_1561487 [Tanacetum coccineum]
MAVYVSTSPIHRGRRYWDHNVAERECKEMHKFERLRKSKGSEEILREIMELYKLEGGDNEKSYLREDGETNMNKKKSRVVNISKGKGDIVEILAKEEGCDSNKRKREE